MTETTLTQIRLALTNLGQEFNAPVEAALKELNELLRRDWDVSVLDAGEEHGVAFEQPAYGSVSRRWWLRAEPFETAATARHAAALAVWEQLDPALKAKIGKCP